MAWVTVAKLSDLPEGHGKMVEVNGKLIGLFKVGDMVYAMDGICLHRGGPVGEGELSGTTVTCPLHGWQYDVTTGQFRFNPSVKLSTYPVELASGEVRVDV
jgi:nitrite reductase/ring-hydroxylating ferredoxin subunit